MIKKGEVMQKSNTVVLAIMFTVFTFFLTVGAVQYSWAETTTSQTTTTTTVAGNGDQSKTVHVEKSETKEQAPKKEESRGLVGSIFGVIGNVIAFPFRVIGGVLKAIF